MGPFLYTLHIPGTCLPSALLDSAHQQNPEPLHRELPSAEEGYQQPLSREHRQRSLVAACGSLGGLTVCWALQGCSHLCRLPEELWVGSPPGNIPRASWKEPEKVFNSCLPPCVLAEPWDKKVCWAQMGGRRSSALAGSE